MPNDLHGLFPALAITTLPALALMAELALITRLARLMNRMAYGRLGRGLYLLLMWPGVAVHELSHAAACVLTGTRVVRVRLFAPQTDARGNLVLGYVEHVVPRSRVAHALIAAAPFAGGTAMLMLLLGLLFPWPIAEWAAGRVALPSDLASAASAAGRAMREIPAAAAAWSWPHYLGLYAMTSVAAHVAPSQSDLRGTAWTVGTLALLAGAGLAAAAVLLPAWARTAAGVVQAAAAAGAMVTGFSLLVVLALTALLALVTWPLTWPRALKGS
jgi:hypothetical protein